MKNRASTPHTKAPANHFLTQRIESDISAGRYSKIITRFPPEPNGYLHLGHAKSICLNFSLAETYNGECNLRFDDTNPAAEEATYVEAIKNDVQWLGFNWTHLRFASDYFKEMYLAAENLIEKGLAYVDESSAEALKQSRGSCNEVGQASSYRNRAPKENLRAFRAMRAGEYAEGSAVLRAKIDLASPFFILRDPVLYRIKFLKHHQTGSNWCIYPMYDFAHCISDAIEGISHSICTLEFQDNRRLYDWVLDHLKPYPFPTRPFQHEFARLNLEGLVLSKRHLNKVVTEGLVDGWDDPRMPTLAGQRRKGVPAQAIRKFCEKLGISKEGGEVPKYVFEDCIRDYLNDTAPRALAVLNPVELIIENWPSDTSIQSLTVKNHPINEVLGSRCLAFSKRLFIAREDISENPVPQGYKRLVPNGNLVRLRHAYVIQATRVEKDASGAICKVYANYFSDSLGAVPSVGKPKGVIHWVNAESAVPAEFRLYSDSFLKRLSAQGEPEWAWNPNNLIKILGVVENNTEIVKNHQAYQFEREGYFYLDPQLTEQSGISVFHQVVGLRNALTKPLN